MLADFELHFGEHFSIVVATEGHLRAAAVRPVVDLVVDFGQRLDFAAPGPVARGRVGFGGHRDGMWDMSVDAGTTSANRPHGKCDHMVVFLR